MVQLKHTSSCCSHQLNWWPGKSIFLWRRRFNGVMYWFHAWRYAVGVLNCAKAVSACCYGELGQPSAFDVIVQLQSWTRSVLAQTMTSFENFLRQNYQSLPIHIELETGMNRLGFSRTATAVLLRAVQNPLFIYGCVQSLCSQWWSQRGEFNTSSSIPFSAWITCAAGCNIIPIPATHIAPITSGIMRSEWQMDVWSGWKLSACMASTAPASTKWICAVSTFKNQPLHRCLKKHQGCRLKL